MSYQTYTTEALVCGTWNRNTADRSYLLFTKEAGMLYADARSVREEKSRQRYGLQDFSHIRVSLVKGKNGWRIGSVEAQNNYYNEAVTKAARGSVVTIGRCLRRFYKGEEAHQLLFRYLLSAFDLLVKDIEHREILEKVVQLRILAELGYIDRKKLPSVILDDVLLKDIVLSTDEIKKYDKLLEQAVRSSQL